MELFELRYALMLAQCQNFSRAAEKLFITQPSLSHQISRLEGKLGFKLFCREARRVTLTEAGELFVAHATKVIKEYESLESEVLSIQKMLKSKITFGANQFSSQIISNGISLFLAEYPETDFNLVETHDPNLIEMVCKGEIELAIAAVPNSFADRDKLNMFPIIEEYVCAVFSGGHPLAGKTEITLEELIPYKLIFSSARTGLKNLMLSAFEAKSLTPQESFEMTSEGTRLPFIRGGAITFSLSEQNSWLAYSDIVRVPITPRICSTICLISPKANHTSRELRGLIDIMLEEAKRHFC